MGIVWERWFAAIEQQGEKGDGRKGGGVALGGGFGQIRGRLPSLGRPTGARENAHQSKEGVRKHLVPIVASLSSRYKC